MPKSDIGGGTERVKLQIPSAKLQGSTKHQNLKKLKA
jgi:hypothetical protein